MRVLFNFSVSLFEIGNYSFELKNKRNVSSFSVQLKGFSYFRRSLANEA